MTTKTAPKRVKVGMEFRAIIADCNALWKVLRSQGKGAWLCEVVNEPWTHDGKTYDGEHAGTQKAFLSQEILASVGMAAMFQRHDDASKSFKDSLQVGDVVHYRNSGNSFVRCEVAINDKGEKYAKPVALVGDWFKHDLPRRMADGTVYLPYHPKSILEPDAEGGKADKAWFPNASCTVESPEYSDRNRIDPRNLEPIDLSVPEMSEQEAEDARCVRLIAKVREATDQRDKAPQFVLDEIFALVENQAW